MDVQGREGSIEVVALDHDVYIPTDNNTGKLTGTLYSQAFYVYRRNLSASSPHSLQSCDHRTDLENGGVLQFYRINDAGQKWVFQYRAG
ncbi:MAG: type VI secretion system tube protein Hcp [Escherichia coli]